MVIRREGGKTLNIKVDVQDIEQVEHFKYLGQVANQEGKSEQEIKIRIAQAKSNCISMRHILTSTDITLALRIILVTCYIYPIVLYGAENWTLLKEREKRIDAFDMLIFRRISSKDKLG